MSIIHLAGDWHGNEKWAERAMRVLAADGCQTLLHVGDFGIFPRARRWQGYDGSETVSLGMDGQRQNIVRLDTETLEWGEVPVG